MNYPDQELKTLRISTQTATAEMRAPKPLRKDS
jgi:hypothetical protein